MVLLVLAPTIARPAVTAVFTFHYGSISTIPGEDDILVPEIFTFHYGSISTLPAVI